MDDPTAETTPDPTPAPAARLTRRGAVRAYAPPALAAVVLAKPPAFGTSGTVKVKQPSSGGPDPGGGKKK